MPTEVTRGEVQRLLSQGVQLVDVLPSQDYEEEHIPGAINMPLRQLPELAMQQLDPTREVVVYCDDPT